MGYRINIINSQYANVSMIKVYFELTSNLEEVTLPVYSNLMNSKLTFTATYYCTPRYSLEAW